MDAIPDRQNNLDELKKLAAQRRLYSEAKATFGLQMALTVGVGIFFSLCAILIKGKSLEPWVDYLSKVISRLIGTKPGTQEFVAGFEKLLAFTALLITIFDVLLLEPRQKSLTQQAARIQEAFDCDVLGLSWLKLKFGDRPAQELINEKAQQYQRNDAEFSKLKNWYPLGITQVPTEVARILCQRTNIWWDGGLRKRYAKWLSGSASLAIVLLVVFGLWRNQPLSSFIYSLLIPLTPGFLWVIRERKKQIETTSTLDRLHAAACELWEQALRGKHSPDELTQAARHLQSEIYDHRKSAPFIFDWVYRRLKTQDEEIMNKTMEDLVREYSEKRGQR